MRHHYAPTRLLDWSRSLYVAAYFAVSEKWQEEEHGGQDGAIWMYRSHSFRIDMGKKYPGYADDPPDKLDKNFYSDPDSSCEMYQFEQKNPTERIVAQQGTFTVCKQIMVDHDQVIDDVISDHEREAYKVKVIIPRGEKLTLLSRLRTMNVTVASLFPGADGVRIGRISLRSQNTWHLSHRPRL